MCVGCSTSRNAKRIQKKECQYLYTELANLDLKTVDIYKKNKDIHVKEVNTILRAWIRDLKNQCPPSDELNIVRKFIEDEYPKYYPE